MTRTKTLGNYLISTDKNQLQLAYIHHYLSQESYWAKNIPLEILERSIEGSFCFGIYFDKQQIGFARVVSDGATFGYLADVFVDEDHRGKGLSKMLMSFILEDENLQSLRRWMLGTLDAHWLYQQFGFTALSEPGRFMELRKIDRYK